MTKCAMRADSSSRSFGNKWNLRSPNEEVKIVYAALLIFLLKGCERRSMWISSFLAAILHKPAAKKPKKKPTKSPARNNMDTLLSVTEHYPLLLGPAESKPRAPIFGNILTCRSIALKDLPLQNFTRINQYLLD